MTDVCIHKFSSVTADGHIFCVLCDIAADEDIVERRNAQYSGPGKTGVCLCGCSWEDHHLGMVMRLGSILTKQGTYEYYIPQECDKYGFNEKGGQKFNEETQMWEEHCNAYVDCGDTNF